MARRTLVKPTIRRPQQVVRPIGTPRSTDAGHLFRRPPALREVVVEEPGYLPSRELVDATTARRSAKLRDLPRAAVDAEHGALDVLLLDQFGRHAKGGSAILESAVGAIPLALDPITRRFRADALQPGEYQIRVAAGRQAGGRRIEIRAGDVTRTTVPLDSEVAAELGEVALKLAGTTARSVRIHARDRDTGAVVVDDNVVLDGKVARVHAPFGRLHWYLDDGSRDSCWDEDHNPLLDLIRDRVIKLDRKPKPRPDPPDWRFGPLDRRFRGVAPILERVGLKSITELAAMEPEGLMHRLDTLRAGWADPIDSRLLAEAIDDARRKTGLRTAERELVAEGQLAPKARLTLSALPGREGTVEVSVDPGAAESGLLSVGGLAKPLRQKISGPTTIRFTVTADQVAAGSVFPITFTNQSQLGAIARLVARPEGLTLGPIAHLASVVDNIEAVYSDLAGVNPGLSTEQPAIVMAPENIRMWLDRARSFMDRVGVCSIDDLGRFRLNPARVFRPGAYVAPAQPSGPWAVGNYAFSEILGTNIYRYLPNDILHDTAVVLAGEWDIRGQSVVIGADVHELLVVAQSIRFDGASRITWETPALPVATAYWPNPAPAGANGSSWGEAGQDGGDGDANPHPSRNGGANAVAVAPIVTMYLLDATGGLPPIDLGGQDGGAGGRGQDGGRGGDGQTGLRADGTFFGGCCRGVGWGGNGGAGGDAGRGGQGGSGGEGGKMTLLTTTASIAALAAAPPTIDLTPGRGGAGGPAGSPGAGGHGGPAGTADCETWCDDHPERRGAEGAGGANSTDGAEGPGGPGVVADAFQLLPITVEQWNEQFNQPHILDVTPDDIEPGQTVSLVGDHFDPAIDRVFFDGSDVGAVASATAASFVVPITTEGGYHPIVVRPAGATSRRSNRVLVRVIPVLDDIPAGTRWAENANVTLTGLAFKAGAQVLAEDRSVTPIASYSLPVVGVTRTSINLQIPGGFLGALRGVRRIVVRNPDGGQSRAERVARISQTIVVRCAAFRVVGTTAGVGTTRSVADIAGLFTEGAIGSVSIPWGPADIVFRLVQPVATLTVDDAKATTWPAQGPDDPTLYANAPGVAGAMNFFFFRDVEFATAYAFFGGGPLFIGDEGSNVLGAIDWQHVVAHELGHALCLRHVCDAGEGPGTFFNRACGDGDKHFLMYPFWPAGNDLDPGQVAPARVGASNFEDGKTASLPATSLFMGINTGAQCMAADTQN